MANKPVYNKFSETMTTAFAAAITMANKLNRTVEDKNERIQNYIGIANAIAEAGLVQIDLMNDEAFANVCHNVTNAAEVANAKSEAKAKEAESAIAKEGKATKKAMKEAADKKMAEIKERKEAAKEAKAPEQQAAATPTPAPAEQAAPTPVAETPAKEEAPKEQAVEAASNPDMVWNNETLKKYASEVNAVNQLIEGFGQETANQLVAQYSNNVYTATAQLLPANIKGFVAYVLELQAQAQSQQVA